MKETLHNWCLRNNRHDLLEEWDYLKNDADDIFIDKISRGSGKKVHWICSNNHPYRKQVYSRTSSKVGCPYCKTINPTLLSGTNDFATTHPHLLEEWDYEKNAPILPEDVTASSNIKAWWVCKECHNSWSTAIRQRSKYNKGCPYCAHLIPILGKTDLKTLYPELIEEWDYSKNLKGPDEYTAYSGLKVWWKCKYCAHNWEGIIRNRTSRKSGCPVCTMKSTSFGEQALYYYVQKVYPDAINRYNFSNTELDVFIPSLKLGIEFDGYYWHNTPHSLAREIKKYKTCKNANIRLIRIRDARSQETHNTCDKIYAIENLHDSKQLEDIIRLLLRDLDPKSNFLTRTNPLQIWSSIDEKIHPELDRFEILEKRYAREIENSLAASFPDLMEDWNYDKNKTYNPSAFTKSSTAKVWWKCHICSQEWEAKIVDRTSKHNKCPVCSNKLLREGFNDFATLYPNLLEEWNYTKNEFLPNKVLKRHNTKVAWTCKKCGFEWEASMGERTRKDKPSGCPQCRVNNASLAKHIKALDRGTFAETHPQYLDEWDYSKNEISPNQVTFGANVKVWWKCSLCGHSWQTLLPNRVKRNSKCPSCKQKKIL